MARDRRGGWRAWLNAIGRILIFLALFLGFFVVGSQLLSALAGVDPAAMVPSSTLTALAALLAGAITIRWQDRRPPGALGIAWTSQAPREIGVGLAIGVGGLVVAVLIMLVAGRLRFVGETGDIGAWVSTTAAGFAALTVAAFAEEVLFRGYPFQVLTQVAGAVGATLVASALFAAAHAPNPNVDAFALLNIFLAGVMLSVAYLRTASLWFATAVHVGWNWAMALLFDLPVSGLELFDTPLYDATIEGPRWFTGGAFGPEAGIVGSIGFGVALIAILRLRNLGVADEMRMLRPLVLRDDGPPALAAGESVP